jgi:uncharacterized SAM-binding protein YcdF (DUF218 family)
VTSSEHRRTRVPLIAALVAAGLVSAPLVLWAALAAAEPLLLVRTALATADVIVVLGGDGPRRAARAAALYRNGAAPRILVTADGDCNDVRNEMVAAGVPPNAIIIECASRNTWENAQFSAPILAEIGVRRAILVTSWFHTRRALPCFRSAAPRVRWISAPVERDKSVWELVQHAHGVQIAQEYLKIGWYMMHYDVDLIYADTSEGEFQRLKGRSYFSNSAGLQVALSMAAVER